MRYDKWQELKPLTAPVPIGTKCVCLVDLCGACTAGTCAKVLECYKNDLTVFIGVEDVKYLIHLKDIALLPSDTAEPAKQERKIVQAFECRGYVHAVCSDGTLWTYGVSWSKLPPIPQDKV